MPTLTQLTIYPVKSLGGIALAGSAVEARGLRHYRCGLTTIDQTTAERGTEPFQTLAGYRTTDRKAPFGQSLIAEGSGAVRVGDSIKIGE